ncbi:kti12, chromatin associated [Exophiala dermatitidis]|uniref:Protein KTI12 n=2 Tax=Exophiala dermatitidis TaxID=5970 RepID=H6C8E1_EXODN|nr:uncharacterized protein HMPREF1120_08333 [Exophiala dermatitidis NIH/UT8656]KAJ4523482.1 kti12, chromatin associated [Exophiala dermatitidis]EHY60368.1 hypothetical protein HMPREF1120_08333 [Exophiala dermatitidis NIH/UT8656]KAJ4524525.1 kti12, chromatin associated [Exophiala dermatitidis]KAJ4527376.1 kti12, chromatin associated [Exophiala dermatitidis]KAJ4530937.1 kti12, chromatin associated [Exophiala dermatitidis]
MPLIIITGLPCSGKTFRAQQIAADLEALIAADPGRHSKKTVQIIPSHHAASDDSKSESLRDQIYNSIAGEKTARAAEFSAIKRAVSRDAIVIADAPNYIKGYRYQLWCEAKAAGTRCCVVHVAAREDECKVWNRERLRAWGRNEDDSNGTDRQQQRQTQGKDILGDLVPESHTAIYGDRVLDGKPRSRSSSLDVGEEDEDENGPRSSSIRKTNNANGDIDTMTLKSLYISDKQHDKSTTEKGHTSSAASNDTKQQQQQQQSSTPSDSIPSLPSTTIVPPSPSSSPPYSPTTLVSLAMRYEPPSPFSRWDTPLFVIPSSDPVPPTQAIWTALFPPPAKPTSKKALSQLSSSSNRPNPNPHESSEWPQTPDHSATNHTTTTSSSINSNKNVPSFSSSSLSEPAVKPHAATVLPKATAADALQILESATMDVTKHVLASAREQLGGDINDGGDVELSIPNPNPSTPTSPPSPSTTPSLPHYETTLHIPAGINLSQPMLQRLRRKYTQIQRGGIAHGQGYIHGRRGVVADFIDFLDREWNYD